MNRDPNFDPADQIERLQLKHDICETAIVVKSALQSEREPEEYFVEFNISDKAVMEHKDKLPQEILENIWEVDSISIEFRYTDPESRPSVGIVVRDQYRNTSVSVLGEDHSADTPFRQTLTYVEQKSASVKDIPPAGFNQFIAALIYPNKTGDFSQFEQVDLFAQDAVPSLIESLRNRFETHEELEYEIPNLGCIVQAASIDGELDRLTVAYSVPRRNVDTSLSGPGLEAEIFTTDSTSSISLGKIGNISNPEESETIKPTSSDFMVLKGVLDEILLEYKPAVVVSFDRVIDLENSGSSMTQRDKRLALQDEELDQHSLDSPDAGA